MSDVVAPHWIPTEGRQLNRWRYKPDTGNVYIEVELTQEKVAICEFAKFDKMQERKWNARRTIGGTYDLWYACTTVCNVTGKQTTVSMHTYLFSDIPAPIDHIDHDGLNNVKSNLRCGSHGINDRNRRTAVGIQEGKREFRAYWTDINGKQHIRYFIKSRYASDEDARVAAKACRDENADRALAEKIATQKADPLQAPIAHEYAPRTKPRALIQTGLRGLTYRHKNGHSPHVRGCVTVDGKRYGATFTLSTYNNDYDTALAAATIWLTETRAAHPKRQKIDDSSD